MAIYEALQTRRKRKKRSFFIYVHPDLGGNSTSLVVVANVLTTHAKFILFLLIFKA
jgi:hypothetical protein